MNHVQDDGKSGTESPQHMLGTFRDGHARTFIGLIAAGAVTLEIVHL
jgi:hypothetical protein